MTKTKTKTTRTNDKRRSTPEGERLQKILSAAGVASRRLSEELITQGRVSVNGKTVTELGTRADPGVDEIKVDGRRIKNDQRRRYILLNKPRGGTTTRSQPHGGSARLHPHAQRSAGASDGHGSDEGRARVRLPGGPARFRLRGAADPDQ